jgi:hypothetical protein
MSPTVSPPRYRYSIYDMRYRFHMTLLLMGALLCAAAHAGAGPAVGTGPVSAGGPPKLTLSVTLEPGQTVFSLGVKYVAKGSTVLAADGVRLTLDRDYMVDWTSGTVLLRRSFPMGAQVEVTYSFVPLELKEVYGGPWVAGDGGTRPVPKRVAPEVAVAAAAKAGGGDRGASLTVGGSKRLGFEFGSGRDVTVSQSLDLDIRGRVGRDVEVRAVLSDRNLPILPEGNTQTLEELDEVYVKVTSPNLSATFGDYTLTGPPSEFGRLSRTVEGVQASAAGRGGEVKVATASPRGRFNSVEFMGEEGKQGAYLIEGADGRRATIVPGSEKVWVDGVSMRRGASADYTIDYALGAITFTSARPVTKDSRITVDYEFSFEEYRRSLHSVDGRAETGAFGVTGSYTVERDDGSSALSGSITDEDRLKFEEMGDAVTDDASPDSASGGADAEVTRPPTSHEIVDFAVAYSPWSALSVRSEVAVSDLDLNTFSGRDDSDNRGTALSLRADLSPRSLSASGYSLGQLEARASVRRIESSFVSMGRMNPAMDYDRWNLPVEAMGLGERRSEFAMRYTPGAGVSVAADVGHLALDDGRASRMLRLSSSAGGARGYQVKWERVKSERDVAAGPVSARDRGFARVRWAVGPLAPAIEAETEKRVEGAAAGTDYTKVGGEIKTGSGGVTSTAALHLRQDYATSKGVRGRLSNAVTQSYGFSYRGSSRLGLEGRYSLRSLAIDSTGAKLNTYVAHFDGSGGALRGALGWRGKYEVTSTDEGPRTVVFVGPGKGHYDADGRYVGMGDYELDESAGNCGLSSRVTMSLNSEVDWGRAANRGEESALRRLLSAARWSGTYRHEEHTRAAIAAPSNIFNPAVYMNEEDVIRATSVARQDVELLPRGRILSPRLRYELRRKIQSSAGGSISGSRLRTVAVRLRSRAVAKATLEGEQVWGVSSPEGEMGAARRETAETKGRVIFRPGRRTQVSLRSSYLVDRSVGAGGGARWEVEPAAGFSFPGRFSLDARCKWARADREGALSYDQLLGWLGDRVEYSLSGQVGLGGGLTLLGTVRATGIDWNGLSHYFKMEMRALF